MNGSHPDREKILYCPGPVLDLPKKLKWPLEGNFEISIGGSVIIQLNDELQNFDGLSNLESVERDFSIWNNNSLKNLTGLDNINHIGGRLSIKYNTN